MRTKQVLRDLGDQVLFYGTSVFLGIPYIVCTGLAERLQRTSDGVWKLWDDVVRRRLS